MSNLATVQQQQPVAIDYTPSVAVTLEQAVENDRRLHQMVQKLMRKDVDYGVVPGTPKPSLLKPGAEHLLHFFGLGHRVECTEQITDWEKGFFYFKYRCDVFKTRVDGLVIQVSSCEGSANSKEKRYRNQDVYSIVNTLQKMAIKRALVGATLQATATSGMFTQDIEDDLEESRPAAHNYAASSKPADNNLATEAQIKAIHAIGKKAGLENGNLKQFIKENFGVDSSKELTRQQASQLIDQLQRQQDNQTA